MVHFNYETRLSDFRDGQNGEPEVAEPGSSAHTASGTVNVSIQTKILATDRGHGGYKHPICHGEAKWLSS